MNRWIRQSLGLAAVLSALTSGIAYADGGGSGNNAQTPILLPQQPIPSNVRQGTGRELQRNLIMSPSEITYSKQQMEDSQYALHGDIDRTPESRIIQINLGPGAGTPTLHLIPDYVTTITVVDRNGNPWPISYVRPGASHRFDVEAPALQLLNAGQGALASKTSAASASGNAAVTSGSTAIPNNMLTVQPLFFGATTNLMVTLDGLDEPIMLMMRSGAPKGKKFDGRVTLRVMDNAPNAPLPSVQVNDLPAINKQMLSFLQQTPPKGAVSMKVSGVDPSRLQVWRWKGDYYVRSDYPLVSPGWTAYDPQGSSAAYKIPITPMLLVRLGGQVIKVSIHSKDTADWSENSDQGGNS